MRPAATPQGAVHEGEFADVGATVNAWLGGKPPDGHPGPSDHRPVKLDNPLVVQWEYASEERWRSGTRPTVS